MVGRFTFVSEAAPTEFSVVICFSSLAGLPDSLVRKDQREVCPLSREVMLPKAQPLSIPLRNGIRFFPHPLPAPLSICLTAYLPRGSDTGSGSRAGLLPPSPLRTRRISFPIASSSLFCRHFLQDAALTPLNVGNELGHGNWDVVAQGYPSCLCLRQPA
jgi:hypothetical protein